MLLTNDSGYWADSATAADAAFRLPETRTLIGELRWGSAAGKGTMAGREQALCLSSSSYIVSWGDYSQLTAPPARFRWLAIHVQEVG